jgi:hypothetical protein
MSKKHTHGPIPKGNQSKHAIDPRRVETDEEDQGLAESEAENQTARPVDDVADEHGRISPAPMKKN